MDIAIMIIVALISIIAIFSVFAVLALIDCWVYLKNIYDIIANWYNEK